MSEMWEKEGRALNVRIRRHLRRILRILLVDVLLDVTLFLRLTDAGRAPA